MANLFEGIFHTFQGLFQSVFAVFQAAFNVVFSLINGVLTTVWGLLESIAQFVGASAHFVLSNFVILGLVIVAFVIYKDRNQRGTVGNNIKKRV